MAILPPSPFAAFSLANWSADWAWGVPLIVLTVVIHVVGLGLVSEKLMVFTRNEMRQRRPILLFGMVLGGLTLFATILHAFEAAIWAGAYRLLGALPENRSAMLYSLNAITSYGHTDLELGSHWHLMGALEALNGWLLFGLTSAFLFAIIQGFGSIRSSQGHTDPTPPK
jgi:hypothetical protein